MPSTPPPKPAHATNKSPPAKHANDSAQALPPSIRYSIIALHEAAGTSYDDIAGALRVPAEVARSVVHRARARAGAQRDLPAMLALEEQLDGRRSRGRGGSRSLER